MQKMLFWTGTIILLIGAVITMNATWTFVPEAAVTSGAWQMFKETLKAAGSYMADHTRLLNRVASGIAISFIGLGLVLAAVYGALQKILERLPSPKD